MEQLFSVSCDPKCGFMVKSHDKDEAVGHAMQHASKKHPEMKVTVDQVREMVKAE